MRGMHPCPSCRVLIGNRAKRCRHCGHGELVMAPSGYVRVYKPGHAIAGSDGYVLEHRFVLHEAGVEIPDGCHVHHRNGVKTDNRIENLEVMPASEHHRHHIREDGVVTNQYGTFPIAKSDSERRERQKARNAAKLAYKVEWQRRKRRAAA